MDSHRDVDLASGDEIYRELPSVEDSEDFVKEAMGYRSFVRVNIDYRDLVFNGHGRGPFWSLPNAEGT